MPLRHHQPPGEGRAIGDLFRRVGVLEREKTGLGTTGTSLVDVFMSKTPSGLWKLNETSGSVARDSSGNGRDLIVGTDSAPTWAQPAGPPGDVTAGFSTAGQRLHYSGFPDLTAGDFTVVGWLYYTDDDPSNFYAAAGQGANLGGLNQEGWCLGVTGSANADPLHLVGLIGNGVGAPDRAVSNNALTAATWYQVALVYSTGTFTLYVDAVAQTDTSTHAVSVGAGELMFGQMNSTPNRLDGRMSWWATVPHALASSDLTALADAATAGGVVAAGLVLTADGTGKTLWALPKLIVQKAGAVVGTRPRVNLIQGTGITITATDNSTSDRVDVTVAAAGGTTVATDPIFDAKGDLVAASAADTAARLPVGSNGQLLTADSTQTLGVKWATPASGGAVTKIYDLTVTGSDVASIDTGAASIAAGYTKLEIVLYARSAKATATDEVWFQFNADAAGNYDWQRAGGVGVTGTFSAVAADSGLDAIIPSAASSANVFGVVRMTVPNYDSTVGYKVVTWEDGFADGSANARAFVRAGVWKNTAAITRLKVVSLNAQNLKVGTRLTVYGYS